LKSGAFRGVPGAPFGKKRPGATTGSESSQLLAGGGDNMKLVQAAFLDFGAGTALAADLTEALKAASALVSASSVTCLAALLTLA
jgi:hypothetical protein